MSLWWGSMIRPTFGFINDSLAGQVPFDFNNACSVVSSSSFLRPYPCFSIKRRASARSCCGEVQG